ncbi:hypothetical protein [Pseudomonas guariconensis]|uniref:hypothetical protein n=1 Tax=Pseudomonas guariconensis TaxID=1288410 RepID=UPI00300D74AF
MTVRVNTDTERQAWDKYAAAALPDALKGASGANYIRDAVVQAAKIADALIEERRKR